MGGACSLSSSSSSALVSPGSSPSSSPAKPRETLLHSNSSNTLNHSFNLNGPANHHELLADDARILSSALGAMKLLAKNPLSCAAFKAYLNATDAGDFLQCYLDLDEIKGLEDDQMCSRTTALVWRYKSKYEDYKAANPINVFPINNSPGNNLNGASPFYGGHAQQKLPSTEAVLWENLGKLRYMDIQHTRREVVMSQIINTQNDVLTQLEGHFDRFMHSPEYKAWQGKQNVEEKRQRGSLTISTAGPSSPAASETGSPQLSPQRLPTCSDYFPNVLIVDDSLVTLKMAGLALERDGHTVQRALNGAAALEMMKTGHYDVVVIDLNMPILDGYETVRCFREYEKSVNHSLMAYGGSASRDDISDMSERSEDSLFHMSASNKELGGGGAAGGAAHHRTPSPTNLNHEAPPMSGSERGMMLTKHNTKDDATLSRTATMMTTTENPVSTSPSVSADVEQQQARAASSSKVPDRRPHQLIIGMSGDNNKESANRALRAGMDYFLPKPFTLHAFLEAVSQTKQLHVRQSASVPTNLSPKKVLPMDIPSNSGDDRTYASHELSLLRS